MDKVIYSNWQAEEFRKAVKALDGDKNGWISEQEFKKGSGHDWAMDWEGQTVKDLISNIEDQRPFPYANRPSPRDMVPVSVVTHEFDQKFKWLDVDKDKEISQDEHDYRNQPLVCGLFDGKRTACLTRYSELQKKFAGFER